MSRAEEQLRRLAEPAFERLWGRARSRFEHRPEDALSATVSLGDPSAAERSAIGGLLGRSFTARKLVVQLADVDAALRSGPAAVRLRDLLEHIGGPLRHLPHERAERQQRLDDALSDARACRHADASWFAEWLAQLGRAGHLTRLDRDTELGLLGTAARVLNELPASRQPLPYLAASVTGDTKALDDGPLTTLVLRALSLWAGAPLPRNADERRDLWSRFGVLLDDLAATVLVLNLRPLPAPGLASWLNEAADEGVPFRVTLHQLARFPLRFGSSPVWLCENPAVLRAAAERLGRRSSAVVCVEGQPSTAFLRLAGMLGASGATFAYHGDFDWAGVLIANGVIARTSARPWRFGTAEYRAAVGRNMLTDQLVGPPVAASWDEALAPAMSADGRVVYEEMVLDDLLLDLAEPKVCN